MKAVDARTLDTLDMIAAALSQRGKIVVGNPEFGETLRVVAFAVREYQRVSPAEEREAWDRYYVAAMARPGVNREQAKRLADQWLQDRRERFGDSR